MCFSSLLQGWKRDLSEVQSLERAKHDDSEHFPKTLWDGHQLSAGERGAQRVSARLRRLRDSAAGIGEFSSWVQPGEVTWGVCFQHTDDGSNSKHNVRKRDTHKQTIANQNSAFFC